nr:protein TsetseEP-like [Leptinotarsa decemlineata]
MASLKSLVSVFAVLCVILCLGAAQNEPPVSQVSESATNPSVPQGNNNPNAPNPQEDGGPKAGEPNAEPTTKPEPIPKANPDSNPAPTPKAEPTPNAEPTPKPEPTPKSEANPKVDPAPKPEPTPQEGPKTNKQAGEKSKEEAKGGAGILYTNCGISVLVGAILLRL